MHQEITGKLPNEITHVVNYSGGAGSYMTAKRVAARHGKEGMVLVFADTLIEDGDLYRFLADSQGVLGIPLVRVADGRTPWDVFKDARFLGNARVAPCSKILKAELLDSWIAEHCTPETCTVYLGIDWSEKHRIDRLKPKRLPWVYEAPMCDSPYLSKQQMIAEMEADGIKAPRLYELGFPHNNCGGGCVKAGQAHFVHLLKTLPDVFAEWERREAEMQRFLERDDVAILRDRRGGTVKPLTLRQLRERHSVGDECEQMQLDWGGCGCAVES